VAAVGSAIAGEVPALRTPPLRVSFSWTLVGNAIYAATQFGMLSALAKLSDAAVVGQYALALAITAPVFMLTNLQLRGVQATDAHDHYQFADYFTLRCLCTVLGLSVIFAIVASSRYDSTTKLVVLLVAAAKAIETVSDVIAGHLQKCERLDQVARALVFRGLASVTTFTFTFWITRRLTVSIIVLAATWLLVICLYDFRVVSRTLRHPMSFHFSASNLRQLAWLSLPLGLAMALNSLSTNVPRYVLEHALGRADLGIFASLAYLVTAGGLISIALGQAVLKRMSRLFADGNLIAFRGILRKLLWLAVALGFAGTLLALTLGKMILAFVYRPEYADHANLLIVMVIDCAVTAASVFLGYGITAARCFRSQVPLMIANLIVTIALAFALIPRFGLLGGGFTLLLSSVLQASASYYILYLALQKRSVA
jgi:O-antigen/teichoic acid export membrane protein